MTDAERRALRALVVFLLLGQGLMSARRHWPHLLPDVVTATTAVAAASPPARLGSARHASVPGVSAATSRGKPDTQGSPQLAVARPLDINVADAAAWCALPGIGPKKAASILTERRRGGPFRSVQDLTRVRGIGPGTVARLRPWLRCGVPHRPPQRTEGFISPAARPIQVVE